MVTYKRGPGNYKSGYVFTVVKTADQIVNNSETLVNDNHLKFSYRTGKRYSGYLILRFSSPANADIDVTMKALTGADYETFRLGVDVVAVTPVAFASESTISTDASIQTMIIYFLCGGSTAAGTCNFKWAQSTAQVADTKILNGSMLVVFEQ